MLKYRLYLPIRDRPDCVFPPGDVQVYLRMLRCGNTVFLITRWFDVAKFTTLTPLSLLSWYQLLFFVVCLKVFTLPSFALRSDRMFVWYFGKSSKICSNFPEKLYFETSLFASVGAYLFRKRYCTCYLSALHMISCHKQKTTFLTTDILWRTKILFSIDVFL
jgi:hypothetical protein